MKLRCFLKKWYVLGAALSLALALSGCMFAVSPDDLFALPKLPEEYVDLETEIDGLLKSGYEYAAPTEGENIQMVQMVDLDGDGTDEALAFLRRTGDIKPLRIVIFQQSEEGYHLAAEIQESGTSIERVEYQDLNGDGSQELIVSWSIVSADGGKNGAIDETAGERALSSVVTVYSLDRYNERKILDTSANYYTITDLDKDGAPELILISGGPSGTCNAMAYQWNAGAMELVSAVKLSVLPAALDEVRVGGLSDGQQALFVTGRVNDQNLMTDILVWRDRALVNCTMDEQTGMSRLVYRDASVRARDINKDGALELPIAYELPKLSSEDPSYRGINWTAFADDGEGQVVETTYHNLSDGWYLVLPESWKDTIMITDVSLSVGERAVTFGVYQGDAAPLEILTIYTETGDSREYKATKGERFVLARQATTVYAAEFLPGSADWEGTMSEDALREAFHMVQAEWYLK